MMKKLFLFAVMTGIVSGFPDPVYAQGIFRDWFPFLFPVEEEGAKPEETLQAPFYDPGHNKKPGVRHEEGLPENAISLSKPHRATREITQWLVTTISETMTFDTDAPQTAFSRTGKYFDKLGRQQYLNFLKENNIIKVLNSGEFSMRSFVQETPILLNEGEVGGSYKWLYEVPIMTSYMDKDMKRYQKTSEPVNQRMLLTIQVGRSPEAEGEHGIWIERWNGTVQKLVK